MIYADKLAKWITSSWWDEIDRIQKQHDSDYELQTLPMEDLYGETLTFVSIHDKPIPTHTASYHKLDKFLYPLCDIKLLEKGSKNTGSFIST